MPAKKTPPPEEEVQEEEIQQANPSTNQPLIFPHTSLNTHREAPVSANIKLYSPGGADIMLTVRSGATVDEVKHIVDLLAEGAKYANDQYKIHFAPVSVVVQPASQPAQAPSQPASIPSAQPEPSFPPTGAPVASAPGITDLTFQTEQLVSEVKGGTTYWKVVGAPFKKFGVRVWDEVLTEAGFAIESMTEPVYNLPGYTAHYIEREPGKPLKVVKLVENHA